LLAAKFCQERSSRFEVTDDTLVLERRSPHPATHIPHHVCTFFCMF
jgi:hypothetical protein